MKILMISMDRKIFEEGSPVRERMVEYGQLFDELHIVVFALKAAGFEKQVKISENTFAYPTNSLTKLLYVKDAEKIGEKVIRDAKLDSADSAITVQDPFEIGLVGKALSQKSSIPLHIQIHTDFYSPYFKKSILNKVRIALSKLTLPHAQAIRVVSERIKSSLPGDMKNKTSVLPIFLDLESIRGAAITFDLRKQFPQWKKIALVASRLTKEKDIETVLEAFASVRRSRQDVGLVIVGAGDEEKKIRKTIKKLKLDESVVLLPWAEHSTLISYMKTCDVFVSSSLYEGYGLSMLEAYAAKAVIVATDAGIAPLIVSDDCLVKPGDAKFLAEGLIRAFQGKVVNKDYKYPYSSKGAYFKAYKADIERALL